MPSVLPSRMTHSSPSQADLDFLSLITSDQSSLGPLHAASSSGSSAHSPENGGAQKKKSVARRESHMDALLLSAVLAGSGPVTRHHVGHGPARPGKYASCDDSAPVTPLHEGERPPKLVMKSGQAPRSERLRLNGHEAEAQSSSSAQHGSSTSPLSSSSMPIPQSSERGQTTSPLSSSYGRKSSSLKDRPRRKMSMDPTPITQTLQMASPSQANFFHPSNISSLASPSATSSRLKVRCMARTRIPTPHGELFLHCYHNSHDQKEHLAIVIDPIQLDEGVRRAAPRGRKDIRSKSLDAKWREGETEMERLVRGAYVGRLTPGGPTGTDRIVEEDESVITGDIEMSPQNVAPEPDIRPLVRIHSECYTGETIGSMRCDCGEQLDEAMRLISDPQPVPSPTSVDAFPALPTPASSRNPSPSSASPRYVPGRGVVIYLRQEGRGIGLLEKIRAYNLQDLGHDTVTANLMLGHGADERKYDIAGEILKDLGLGGEGVEQSEQEGIRLLTNNPEKVEGLAREGIKISERVGMTPRDWKCRPHSHSASANGHGHAHAQMQTQTLPEEAEYQDWRMRRAGVGLIGAGKASGPELERYLRTKVERMGHSEWSGYLKHYRAASS